MLFEWDPVKARENLKKHSVSFEEAGTAFEDELSITIEDPFHSLDEDRFILLGFSKKTRLLAVVHTDRHDRVRIISAGVASRKERKDYEESI